MGAFLHADAVLTGDRPAEADAEVQDLAGHLLGAVVSAGDAGVVEDQRVQVAIAGVEDVGHRQAVLLAQRLDAGQRFSQAASWHHAVLHHVLRAEPAHGRERTLAPFPDQQPFGVVLGGTDLVRTRFADHFQQALEFNLDLHRFTFQLDDHQPARVQRIAGMGRFLGCLDGQRIHDFHRAGQQAAGDHHRDCIAGCFESAIGGQHRAIGLDARDQPQGRFQRDAEQTLAANEEARQVRSRCFQAFAAEADHLAISQHDLQAQDMVAGHAVLQAVDAA